MTSVRIHAIISVDTLPWLCHGKVRQAPSGHYHRRQHQRQRQLMYQPGMPALDRVEQCRAEQCRAEQCRAEQCRAGQKSICKVRAGHSRRRYSVCCILIVSIHVPIAPSQRLERWGRTTPLETETVRTRTLEEKELERADPTRAGGARPLISHWRRPIKSSLLLRRF
jgi:hypothetical protein